MNAKEAKRKIEEMRLAGTRNRDVFAALQGQGLSDRRLAYLIASRLDPRRCAENRRHAAVATAIIALHVAIALLLSVAAGVVQSSLGVGLVSAGCSLLVGGAFLRGFMRRRAGAYNIFLGLSIAHLPRQLGALSPNAIEGLVGLGLSIAMIVYINFVRQRLFPDLGFSMAVRKTDGRYVFTD
ncbi:hypothetical protein [Burkholderia sp. A1]|uniref:hypothetical protein n=1 Tax=Burkholderia sp. A1 TaxID=148446 RepID=UPI000469B31C|nr:hypothetical protein [Burkholderia sp. A1]